MKSTTNRGRVITFGCRLNACESDIIKEFAEEIDISNFVLINTCAVTAEAERKLRQAIRKLYNADRHIKIILTGCASDLNPEVYMQMDGVVGIISNKLKLSKSEYLKYSNGYVLPQSQFSQKVRGFLQIQNGCDHRCTYCVVRLVRGPNVSFSKEEIAAQAKRLLAKGYKELVLTGVNISSYGCDLRPRQNLASIVKYLLEEIPELRRLRLSSLDPADIDTELINVIANEDRLMPHIHESIQSGDNIVLKRMLRRHTREQLIDLNQQILQARPDIVLGADLIVGFPTETDEMFSNTKTLLKEANLSLLHIFSFSARDGTAAALMPQVAKNIVTNRAKELKVLAKEFLSNKISEYMGKTVIVLAENEKIAKTNSFLTVRSRKKMKIGRVYSFYCDSIDETIIVGYPISEIIQDSI